MRFNMEFEQQVAEDSWHKMELLNSYRANKSLKKVPMFKILTVVFFSEKFNVSLEK